MKAPDPKIAPKNRFGVPIAYLRETPDDDWEPIGYEELRQPGGYTAAWRWQNIHCRAPLKWDELGDGARWFYPPSYADGPNWHLVATMERPIDDGPGIADLAAMAIRDAPLTGEDLADWLLLCCALSRRGFRLSTRGFNPESVLPAHHAAEIPADIQGLRKAWGIDE